VIDPEETFDTTDHAADCTAKDATNRTCNAIALVCAVSNAPGDSLPIRRDH
jgi:hypothetical protein